MKFGTRIYDTKLDNGIKYQAAVMQRYICNMCWVVNKAQCKTT